MRRGAIPVVVRGWKAWKKRMNLRYWGIFWRVRPIGEMEMNLVMLKMMEIRMTGKTWMNMIILGLRDAVLSYQIILRPLVVLFKYN